MKVVAIYLRISLEDSVKLRFTPFIGVPHKKRIIGDNDILDESNSITNQRFLLKEFIRENIEFSNCEIREYSDDGYSGTNFERPGVTKLFADLKRNLISCIIVKDFSRFSRDYIEMGTYLDQIFPFMGVRFISLNDNYDSKNHKGTTVEIDTAFKTLLNDFYCKDISLKIKTAFSNKCANGEYIFGQTPFGYEKMPNKRNQIRVNEKEAEIVRYIFELSVSGLSPVAIEKRLHKEQIQTCFEMRGKKRKNDSQIYCWSSMMVRKILDNRFYIGEFMYHKSEQISVGSNKTRRLPKSEWITIRGHHEAIISDDLFEKAKYNKTGRSTKRKNPKHPLTGKLYCGGCGFAMVYKREVNKKVYRRFECIKHSQLQIAACCTCYKADILEELVLTMLNKELMKLADLKENTKVLKSALKSRMDTLNERIRDVGRQTGELEQRKSKAYEDYAECRSNVEEYKQIAEMTEQMIEENRILVIRYQEDLTETEKAYFDNLDDLKQILRYSQVNELSQEVVDTFIHKIRVFKNKAVEIEWAFAFMQLNNEKMIF